MDVSTTELQREIVYKGEYNGDYSTMGNKMANSLQREYKDTSIAKGNTKEMFGKAE